MVSVDLFLPAFSILFGRRFRRLLLSLQRRRNFRAHVNMWSDSESSVTY